MTLSRSDLEAPLAEHFGKAKWLVVVDGQDHMEFFRNAGLDGRWVAREFAARGCTDVIAGHIGPGAWEQLVAAGMRVWAGDPGEPASALATAFEEGRLRLLCREALGAGHDRHRAHGHGG